jgi:hypothetical protein
LKALCAFKDRVEIMEREMKNRRSKLTECGGNMDDNSLVSDDRFLKRRKRKEEQN